MSLTITRQLGDVLVIDYNGRIYWYAPWDVKITYNATGGTFNIDSIKTKQTISESIGNTTVGGVTVTPDNVEYYVQYLKTVAIGGGGGGGDMTPEEIKLAYESNPNTNAYTDAEKAKLAGLTEETTATIKEKYESNPDTNAYTDAEKTKLAGLHNYNDTQLRTDISSINTKIAGINNEITDINTDLTTVKTDVENLSGSLDGKQDTLVSGVNIKTINNQSLLGAGNITVGGGGGGGSVESVNGVSPDASGNVQLPKIDQLPDDVVDFIQANTTRNASNNSITYFRKNLTTGSRTPNYVTLQAVTQTEAGLMTAYDKTKLDTDVLLKSGDTMTGSLTLNGDPTTNLMAATKEYVDREISLVETQALTFEGFISINEPTGDLREGNLWYQPASAEDIPDTTFPWQVKTYTSGAWSATTTAYTPVAMDMWTNLDASGGVTPTSAVMYRRSPFTYDGTNATFTLPLTPIVSNDSAVEVRVENNGANALFLAPNEFTVSGNTVTITDSSKLVSGALVMILYNA